jgi:NAD(P)-dependent dehydrogenase (short-subunit alcohol dehydrogenase family)
MSAERVALVTGGASGIGRAAAAAFAQAGAAVVVGDRDPDGGRESVADIERAGGRAVFAELDVTDLDQVVAAVGTAARTFGGLDWAFNCAGIQGPLTETAEFDEEAWARVLAVNLTGLWRCMKHEIPLMLERGGGAIVNAASNFGLVAAARMAAYAASKHGVLGLTKVAAIEYATRGVRVNAVCPGTIDTPMVAKVLDADPVAGADLLEQLKQAHPIGRLGAADEVAAAVVWLCSDSASFVTGVALPVDGGYTIR